MVDALYRRLIQPGSATEEARRREALLNGLLVASLGIAGVALAVLLARAMGGEARAVFGSSTLALALIIVWGRLLRASRRGRHLVAATGLIGSWYVTYVGLVLWKSVMLPATVLMAMFLVVIAATLLGGRGATWIVVAIAAADTAQAILGDSGVVVPDNSWRDQIPVAVGDVLLIVVFCAAIAAVLWHSQREYRRSISELLLAAGAQLPPARYRTKDLTMRETEVVQLVAEGISNKEISERLFLSPRTVQGHIRNAMRKTDTTTRTELAVLAVHEGLTQHQLKQST